MIGGAAARGRARTRCQTGAMHRPTLWRAVVVQAVAVAAISVALGLALPHSFFEDWGWVAGPGAWAVCALVTARVLRLPVLPTLAGAALAGLPSLVAVIAGVHWLGAAVAVVVFGLWCGRLADSERARPQPA
jgi:hypothetical protein